MIMSAEAPMQLDNPKQQQTERGKITISRVFLIHII